MRNGNRLIVAAGCAFHVFAQGCSKHPTPEATGPVTTGGTTASLQAVAQPANNADALSKECSIGVMAGNTPEVTIGELLHESSAGDIGRLVRVRGLFRLAFDLVALADPSKQTDMVPLDLAHLPREQAEQLYACRSRLLDVQGYVREAPKSENSKVLVEVIALAPSG